MFIFEVTKRWHSQPGSLVDRPGFRAMELHTLWFEFVCPWWESSLNNPEEVNFKETFSYISTIENEEVRNMKKKQVKNGIKAGYNQMVKLSEILLSVPVLFCALTDPKRGPALARALVFIVKKMDDLSWMEYQFDGE